MSVIVITGRREPLALTSAIQSAREACRGIAHEIVLWGNGVDFSETSLSALGIDQFGASAHNLGVARGRNAAARLARGQYLLFLDDDARLEPESVRVAVAELRREISVKAVAFHIKDPSTHATALWYFGEALRHAVESGETIDVPWFIGCAHIVDRTLFESLDGYWGGYFREMEEVDLGLRIIHAGYRIRLCPRSVALHQERNLSHFYHSVVSNLKMIIRLSPPALAGYQLAAKVAIFTVRAHQTGELRTLGAALLHVSRDLRSTLASREPLGRHAVQEVRQMQRRNGVGNRVQWLV